MATRSSQEIRARARVVQTLQSAQAYTDKATCQINTASFRMKGNEMRTVAETSVSGRWAMQVRITWEYPQVDHKSAQANFNFTLLAAGLSCSNFHSQTCACVCVHFSTKKWALKKLIEKALFHLADATEHARQTGQSWWRRKRKINETNDQCRGNVRASVSLLPCNYVSLIRPVIRPGMRPSRFVALEKTGGRMIIWLREPLAKRWAMRRHSRRQRWDTCSS